MSGMDLDVLDSSDMLLSAGDKVKLLAKIYCHGGDVAFFGSVDLEGEAQINYSLYGHSGVCKKHIAIPMKEEPKKFPSDAYTIYMAAHVGQSVCERLGGCGAQSGDKQLYKYSSKYIVEVTYRLCHVLSRILEAAYPNPGRLTIPSLLDIVRRLRSVNRIPASMRWEETLLDRIIAENKLG